MFDSTVPVFPESAVMLIADRLPSLDPNPSDPIHVVKRPLRSSDPTQTIGVFGTSWEPETDSYEFRGHGEPTLQRYLITVQAFVQDYDEERGLATHSVMAKRIRAMLYRDEPLRVGLAALSVTASGSTERPKRWGVRGQRFISNEIDAAFLFMSVMDFWLETETV